MVKNRIELLSPVGSAQSLIAAVRCGANAVYLGGQYLNARQNADNFNTQELIDAVKYCHIRGVKVFFTLNTLVFDNEEALLTKAIEDACHASVDAIIVQDMALVTAIKSRAPNIALHASTQMSIHNVDGAKMLEQLGFARVVLAREMQKEEIAKLVQNTEIETECFVHGALCMSISGQCTMSSIIGGRSGNRGLCAQPCRLPFAVGNSTHALSLRDLSMVESIPQLVDIGVTSIKIEGRMKRPEYVAAATTACRNIIDGKNADIATLKAVFSRTGFTDGYFTGKRNAEMFGTRQKEDVESAMPVLKGLRILYKDELQSVPVKFSLEISKSEPVKLIAEDCNGNTAQAQSAPPQEALNAPTTVEKAVALLNKTGGTPYTLSNISTKIDNNLMVPASQINALRREVLEELSALRGNSYFQKYNIVENTEIIPYKSHIMQRIRVRLHTHKQFSNELAEIADEIILPLQELSKLDSSKINQISDRLLVELPRFLFNDEYNMAEKLTQAKQKGVNKAIVGNLGGINLAKNANFEIHGDFGLNIVNTGAIQFYAQLGLKDITLSTELELNKIKMLGSTIARGIIAYGYLPLMAFRNCPIKANLGCKNCNNSFPELKDRLGNRFIVDCRCKVAELYNCVPLFLADKLNEFKNSTDFLTLYFTKENPDECLDILNKYKTGEQFSQPKTRGLYYRNVL